MKHRYSSLTMKMILLMLIAGTLCVIVYSFLFLTGSHIMEDYFETTGFQEKQNINRAESFQKYVTARSLRANDSAAITEWIKQQPLILIEIYRGNILTFTSAAPQKIIEEEDNIEVPHYDWVSYYPVDFADGEAEVVFYANDTIQWNFYLTLFCGAVAILLFIAIFLFACSKIVQYICKLSLQIQEMESGNLNVEITISGNNELTQLARSLDSMRFAFKEQRRQEAEIYHAHQSMITFMSHDLRTPLTTLQIYTDILRYKKYDPEQFDSYLGKIDAKTKQITQLAENIFMYSISGSCGVGCKKQTDPEE